MILIKRTDSENKDFINLVQSLDNELTERDGDEYSFYAQFNKIEEINFVVIAHENEKPLGCGGMKQFEPGTMEIKRMFVAHECRGKGIATKLLSELENWASELSIEKCILETGKRQTEAIRLYKKNGYNLIPNYGQYTQVENSLCFEKEIK